METWRHTYTYSTSELIEILRTMRQGTYTPHTGWLERREVYLQANDRGLIRLPEGTIRGDCHTIPFANLKIIDEAINRNESLTPAH